MKLNSDSLSKIRDALSPVIASLGGELVDLEYAKKHGEDNLTVFVFFPPATTLNDCERVHYAVSPVLDEINPSSDAPYVLNVSSPGLDRAFKSQRDYERNYGNAVEVKLFAPLRGKKLFSGILLFHDQNVTEIEVDNGKKSKTEGLEESKLKLENSKIASVKPFVDLSRIS